MSQSLLVVDVGTSSVRSAIVRPDGTVTAVHKEVVLPLSPEPGQVELDASRIASAALATARAALGAGGPVGGVGIANQRASTIVWERATGTPVGPAIGWQDLRTVINCLILQGEGLRLAPNASATKLAAILDLVDPDRSRASAGELCFGTVDSFVAWHLSEGSVHVTDATNAAVTSLVRFDGSGWDERTLEILSIPEIMLPRIVDSIGVVGQATALEGAPPICGIAGDQQASLIGQGCTSAGMAKITFGTGGMLDVVLGATRPEIMVRGEAGTFPIVTSQRDGVPTWGLEAVMLSAGTAIEWLRDDLGLLDNAAQSAELAACVVDTGGVMFVPALLGLGTPVWDFGARGTLIGITRGTTRAHIVRAVLEGVAHRGADLVLAAESDAAMSIEELRVDGGMSANPVFSQMLADVSGRPVALSGEIEATTRGAGFLAGLAIGTWSSPSELTTSAAPRAVLEPMMADDARTALRDRWLDARSRSEAVIPDLSGVQF